MININYGKFFSLKNQCGHPVTFSAQMLKTHPLENVPSTFHKFLEFIKKEVGRSLKRTDNI